MRKNSFTNSKHFQKIVELPRTIKSILLTMNQKSQNICDGAFLWN